jgi:large subunit ribosomal protein L33
MAKKNLQRNQIYIECTSCRTSGVPGVSRYTTEKNRRNNPDRLEVTKYCRYERKRTVHREIK